MGYGSILTLASGQPEDDDVLAVSAELASAFGCLAQVLPVIPDPAVDMVAMGAMGGVYVDAGAVDALKDQDRRSREQIVGLAQTAAQRAGAAFGDRGAGPRLEMIGQAGPAWLEAWRRVRLTDLVVFGARAAREMTALSTVFSDILLSARSPVLVVHDRTPVVGGVAAVAWNGGLCAGRAVRAALPLLAKADRVVIVHDPQHLGEDEHVQGPPEQLASYLRLHGVQNIEPLLVSHAGEGEPILNVARSLEARLLVAGAYGHTRLREWVFGGATRTFVRSQTPPHRLLAH